MIRIKTLLHVLIIFLVSVYINFLSAKVGVLPIDSFAFFDTGYLITKGFHPIKDIWISTGLLVDYMQALFFKILG